MRRIATHYLIDRSRVIARPLIELDDSGRVLSVGEWERLDNIPSTEFYAGALTAGFVNAHSHVELSYLRGAIARGSGFGGFARAIGAVRDNFTQQQREDAMRVAMKQMWHEGVQAVGDIINGDSSLRLKAESPIIWHNFAECFGLRSDLQSIERLATLVEQSAELGLKTTITPHSTYSLQDAVFRKIGEGAGENKGCVNGKGEGENEDYSKGESKSGSAGPLSIHFMESEDEAALYAGRGSLHDWYERMGWECDFLHYGSPAGHLVGSLASDSRLVLVHNCCLTQEDYDMICGHFSEPVSWVLCPCSNDYISSLRPPVELLRKAGARIALGTDSLASNENLSMLDEIRALGDVPLAEALAWATIGGAEALGLEHEIGSVEEGKRPGIVLLEGLCIEKGEPKITPFTTSRRLI